MAQWNRQHVHQVLRDSFSEEEFSNLVYFLGQDQTLDLEFENLPGQTFSAKITSFLDHLERWGKHSLLIEWLNKNRKHIDTSGFLISDDLPPSQIETEPNTTPRAMPKDVATPATTRDPQPGVETSVAVPLDSPPAMPPDATARRLPLWLLCLVAFGATALCFVPGLLGVQEWGRGETGLITWALLGVGVLALVAVAAVGLRFRHRLSLPVLGAGGLAFVLGLTALVLRATTDYNRDNVIKADSYIKLGIDLANERKCNEALEQFKLAIDVAPRYYSGYYNRGNQFFFAEKGYNEPPCGKDYEQAIADFNSAIQRAGQFAEAYNNRALAYAGIGGQVFDQRSRDRYYNLAMADFAAALMYPPDPTLKDYKEPLDHDRVRLEMAQTLILWGKQTTSASEKASRRAQAKSEIETALRATNKPELQAWGNAMLADLAKP